MANYSLLRYPGGKTKAVNILKKYIPIGCTDICSPFFGGGSFEIYCSFNGIKIHGSDNFYPLVCFWKSVLTNRTVLIEIIKSFYPLDKTNFYRLQKTIHELHDVTLIGAIFYVLNRSSFSGTGLSGGMSIGHPRFTLKQIERIKEFTAQFEIEHCSFEKQINRTPHLIYADPPYLINQNLYGSNGDLHKNFNHSLLAEQLNKRGNFILSYNNHEKIKEMYSNHIFYYPEWKYGMGNNKNSTEILIISNDL